MRRVNPLTWIVNRTLTYSLPHRPHLTKSISTPPDPRITPSPNKAQTILNLKQARKNVRLDQHLLHQLRPLPLLHDLLLPLWRPRANLPNPFPKSGQWPARTVCSVRSPEFLRREPSEPESRVSVESTAGRGEAGLFGDTDSGDGAGGGFRSVGDGT